MAALITLDELEKALGGPVDNQDQAQYTIDMISSFVNSKVSVSFEKHENETFRSRSDAHGTIRLVGPVDEVAGVTRPNSACTVNFRFDDLDLLYNLQGNTAYDVTATWGYDEVPDDIKFFVTEACKTAINNPNSALSFRVGDVTETFIANAGNAVQTPTIVLGADVLLKYVETAFTVTVGSVLPLAVQDSWSC